jgi:hypothetical protein
MSVSGIRAQRLKGGDNLRVRVPEIGGFRVSLGHVGGEADVEHGLQPLLPLFDERRRADDEEAPDQVA